MSRPSSLQLAAGAGVLALAGGAVAGYAIGGQAGLLAVVAAGEVVALAAFLVAWRDLRRGHRRLHSGLRALENRVKDSTTTLRRAADDSEARVVETLRSELTALGKEQSGQTAAELIQSGLRKQFQQVEALAALYYEMRPRLPIPPTRTWVASPDLLRYLYETVRHGNQRLVVECGSGVSTVVFAYGLRARGSGRVVAVEHDPHYAEITQRLLDDHELAEWAEVRLAPLKPVSLYGEDWPWYELSAVPAGPIDLLLVDGPPGAVRDQSRFPALPLLYDRLADGAMVVLDDYQRDAERAVAKRWQELYPELLVERLKHEKGTLVLRRPPA